MLVTPKSVLVIGGEQADNTFIRTSLAKRLFGVGLIVKWVWAGDRIAESGGPIPESCELVIILTDWVGHAITDRAIAQAKKQNVPWLRGVHQWSKLCLLLLDAKIISQSDLVESQQSANGDGEPEPLPEGPSITLPPEPPPPQLPASWEAAGKPLDDLLRVFRNVVAELITGHDCCNFQITDSGHITVDVRKRLDLNDLRGEMP